MGIGHRALGIGHWADGLAHVPHFFENRYIIVDVTVKES